MNLRYVSCFGPAGFRRLAYREWDGPPGAPTVICVHGLTRNSRDFDTLAESLSRTHRVICPDIVGRGESDPAANPDDYAFPTYLADIATLIARLDVEKVDWVGTSMGALIAIFLAATPGHPIRRLVVNDAGAVVPKAFLQVLAAYVGMKMDFDSAEALEAATRLGYSPQPDLSDAQWRQLALAAAKPSGAGYRLAYDPRIGDIYRTTELQDFAIWPFWDKVDCPTLILRGGLSAVLSAADAAEMVRRRPGTQLVEFPGHAHAPWLMNEAQISVVREFLAG